MKKLLIIDDDPDLLESLRAVFGDRYEVTTASSAEAAAEQLRETPADVILLDVVLPGIDGVAFLRELRRDHPDLPVVMISAASSIQPVMEALDLGACDYVRKPFDVADLRHVVARALQTGQMQQRIHTLEQELARRPFAAEPGDKPMKTVVEDFERILIRKALRRAGGVQTRAAQTLGITRRILRYRIEKLGINPRSEAAAD